MNSQQYKEKFGVSKTAYKNMKKKNLLSVGMVTTQTIVEYKTLRKSAQAKIRRVQQSKHSMSALWRRTKGKARKRRDGKIRGSVSPRSRA